MNNYVPLHVHTHYSQMDGVATPDEYVAKAIENGMSAIAITDHGTLSGHRVLPNAFGFYFHFGDCGLGAE